MVSDLLGSYLSSYARSAAGAADAFLPLDEGLSIISRHAKEVLGYDTLILLLDELVLWLSSRLADEQVIAEQAQEVSKFVESAEHYLPAPIVSLVPRQRDLRGLGSLWALGFLRGLLTVLRTCGHPGLLVVLDEVETLQRVRTDVRENGLNALTQLIDEVDSGRFPGLYLVITGTPAFFDRQQGAQRLQPLAQRLATDFSSHPRFDSPRAIQLRLTGFDLPKLIELGRRWETVSSPVHATVRG